MTFSGADTDWPLVGELKQLLDITGSEWDDELDRQVAAAIAQVKLDVGDWDEMTDLPDESLAQAAIRMAVLMRANADTGTTGLGDDPIYRALLKGHRRRFPFA
jgi:hypothetical protein